MPLPLRSAMLVAALAAPGAACTDEGARPTAVVEAPDSADQVLSGFSHYVTRDGLRRSRLQADSAYFYENDQRTVLTRVRVTFYDEKGADASTLTAAHGVYRWIDGSMDAAGSVVVVGSDGGTLRTERLKYDEAGKLITTDLPFTFDRGDEHVRGSSFRSDPDFKNVVTGKPRGVLDKGFMLPGE